MIFRFVFCGILTLNLVAGNGFAQCTSPDFTIPANACIGSGFTITNNNVFSEYTWDFCEGDLEATPVAVGNFSNNTFLNPSNIVVVEEAGAWYGFIVGRGNNRIARLEYGTSLQNTPTVIDLGDFNSAFAQIIDIELYKEGGLWYALVADASANRLFRLSFSSINDNAPTLTSLDAFNNLNLLNLPVDLKIVEEGGNVFALVANYLGGGIITKASFGTSITNAPAGINISLPASGNVRGVGSYRACNNWSFWVTMGNSIFSLQFDSGLMSAPTINTVSPSIGITDVIGVDFIWDNSILYALVQSDGGNLYKLKNANTLTPLTTNLGLLSGQPTNNNGLQIVKSKSDVYVFLINNPASLITQIKFPLSCGAVLSTSKVQQPQDVSYIQSGGYNITLRTKNANGSYNFKSKAITVSSLVAPDLSISSQNNCVGNVVNFSSTNISGGISTYGWDFGDSGSAAIANPSHTYSSVGAYTVKLNVTSVNGCLNSKQISTPIYNQPVSDFTLPASSPVCTNQTYLFLNTSNADTGSNPSWEWRLNGNLVSTSKDYSDVFTAATSQQIKLKVSIPGCSNEKTSVISTVLTGPAVDFLVSDNCQGTSVSFNNTTVGTVTGFTWDFGDASTSTQSNASHVYSTHGTFQAKLTASNAAGCQNFATKSIKIYSLPAPDFSVGLPPFSCSNSATAFQNNTPALTDSNITSWAWQFGDNIGTSLSQTPSYTYLSANAYLVSLTAKSEKGCSASVVKSISIAPGPVPDFSVGPACLNQSTKFTDLSSGGVQTRSWQIASTAFSTPNPSYTFNTSGDFSATLTVTSANSCSSFKTKTVNVPVPPTLSFNSTNLCSGQNAHFADVTQSQQDAIIGWNWNFAGNSSTGNPADFNFNTSGTYNVKLTTTHSSGCKYTLSKNVLVNTSPVANFTATPDRGSAPLIVQFTNTSQLADSYVWNFYDKSTASSTQTSPSYTFISLGDYSAELTAKNLQGCVDKKTIAIKVLVPSIDLQLTDFTLTPDPTTGKLKGIVKIYNSSNIPVTSAEVSLILADKAIVNETLSINLDPGQSISKTLSFTISPNQFDFNYLCAKIISEKDIEQSNNKRCINLETTDYFFNPYPNPTAGTLHVDWISVTSASAHIVIYDNMGKRCYDWQTLSVSGLNQAQLDITFLTSGIYYLSIETSGVRKTSRFFRE